MIEFVAVAVPAVISGFSLLGSYLLGIRTEHARADADVAWLRSELRQANDRLYAVSREPGALVPTRDEPIKPPTELPPELEGLVSDWESTETQETLRAQFASLLDQGYSPTAIKRQHLES